MTTTRRPVRLLISVAVISTIASCGTDGDSGVASLPDVASSIATSTIEAPSTSEVTASTEATTTTTAPAPPTTPAPTTTVAGPPTLQSNGIGSHEFGGPTPDELIAELSSFLGSPTAVLSNDYPDGSSGFYESADGESGFAYPSGRTACFSNALCVEFGGADPSSLRFVGYRQTEGAGSLTTASGVTAGTAGSAFPAALVVEPGGCYSTGTGTADGVSVFLRSNGEWFGYFDDDTGNYVTQAPPIDDVVVLSVFGGDEPFFLYDDC